MATSAVDELALRQTLFREVNENIATLAELLAGSDRQLFLCECSNAGCVAPVELTTVEYEAVRRHGARFVVLPGHQLEELERVVGGDGRFLVVEKVSEAADIARAHDPRPR